MPLLPPARHPERSHGCLASQGILPFVRSMAHSHSLRGPPRSAPSISYGPSCAPAAGIVCIGSSIKGEKASHAGWSSSEPSWRKQSFDFRPEFLVALAGHLRDTHAGLAAAVQAPHEIKTQPFATFLAPCCATLTSRSDRAASIATRMAFHSIPISRKLPLRSQNSGAWFKSWNCHSQLVPFLCSGWLFSASRKQSTLAGSRRYSEILSYARNGALPSRGRGVLPPYRAVLRLSFPGPSSGCLAVAAIPAARSFAIRFMSFIGTGLVSGKWIVPFRRS